MFIVDKLLNFIVGKKNCIKKNPKAITGNLIQSWQHFTCTLFCLVDIHFSQAILYSLLEFGNVFGRPVLFIDFSLQIRPEIFNWARFWRCCWIVIFWHKTILFVPEGNFALPLHSEKMQDQARKLFWYADDIFCNWHQPILYALL